MEVAVAEEKKKIFRARKTMKISDRQQLDSLHNTLSSTGRPSSNSSSPPPLLNGTHKEDGQKGADGDTGDSKSPAVTPPVSPGSRSPLLGLSLSLSPSPPALQSPKANDDTPSPSSPFHSLNNELKKMEEEGKKARSPSPPTECPRLSSAKTGEGQAKETTAAKTVEKPEQRNGTEKEETRTTTKGRTTTSIKDSALNGPVSPATSDKGSEKGQRTEQKDSVKPGPVADSTESKAPEERHPSPKFPSSSSSSSPSPSTAPGPAEDIKGAAIKGEKEEADNKGGDQGKKTTPKEDEEMEVDSAKPDVKKIKKELKVEVSKSSSSSGSSSTSSNAGCKEEKSTSGPKRSLSESDGIDGQNMERDGKRQRMNGVELEAQLELKITAKAGSRHKLEKVVQQLVEERLRVLELTVFDQSLQELKERVEKIDCATKHQSTINTLQAKIARLAKKFGEANQSTENKKKEVLTTPVAKTSVTTNTTPIQRPVRTSVEVKQTPTMPSSTNPTVTPTQPKQTPPTSTASSAAMVTQGPILHLISPTTATTSTLGNSATQSQPTGTLLLKATSGTNMVGHGQPLLIQLPLSMTNGQAGALVNIPVSSFAAVNSNNKSKTTTPTTTFILKAAPSTTTGTTVMVPAIQASTSQMTPAQISLARYQGGAGGISTPHAGVSVATARMPSQSVSVAGAVSSTSSPAASGPAATGSTAPGTPSGTTMTSKTDNQASGSTPTKTPVQGPRPKGSVIDLTEDDDDVQVTGVKKAIVVAASSSSTVTQRPPGPPPLISTPTSATARSSPQHSVSSPQHTVHHRPPLDSPVKTRLGTRTSSTALPPLPAALQPTTRLPLEASQTSPPQQPQLKLARVQSQNGIVLSWCVAETDRSCAAVDSYHLYAYHMDNSAANGPASQHWKKIGEVKALPLPMACTLTQFVSGSTYYFAVRARDIYGRFGLFCEPQCTDVISSATSSS